ncbi:MAG: hypothetical protein ACPF9D_04300 [Owenweeksia sp.]
MLRKVPDMNISSNSKKYMKKVSAAMVVLIMTIGFFACKKVDQNPDYTFTITVRTLEDSTLIQNSRVEAYVPPTVGSKIAFIGYSDEKGQITFNYDKDAVFQVRATRGSSAAGSTPVFIGCTYVKLEPNQHVYQTVYIRPYDPEAPGCTL